MVLGLILSIYNAAIDRYFHLICALFGLINYEYSTTNFMFTENKSVELDYERTYLHPLCSINRCNRFYTAAPFFFINDQLKG